MVTNTKPFDGDRPISNKSADRLGFEGAAIQIAHAITNLSSPEGFVFGIEGRWGSGKSSMVNLVADALLSREAAIEIVRFSPWLITSRDALLKELFAEIGKAALRVEIPEPKVGFLDKIKRSVFPDRFDQRRARRERLKRLFTNFSSHLSRVGKAAEIAGALGLPGAGTIDTATEAGSKALCNWITDESLEVEKLHLRGELTSLTRKVVVFVDDLDRLEPTETIEVLRLVRAVADFPNIVYVLCYSREVLSQNLAKALRLEDGEDFIEKIVQTTFTLPQPEAFDLRRMFRAELQSVFPEMFTGDTPGVLRMIERLRVVIDTEGARTLQTPRNVGRAINSLRFYAGAVLENIDFADAVWLQLIRVRSLALYQWIESYMTGVAALAAGATMSNTGKVSDLNKLKEICNSEDSADSLTFDELLEALGQYLPGIEMEIRAQDTSWKLYERLSPESQSSLVIDRRIGSPQHYRFYFALSCPQGALTDSAFRAFINSAVRSPADAGMQFLSMASTEKPQGGVIAEALLDRLQGAGINVVPVNAVWGIIMAIADGVDTAALKIGEGDMGRYWIWVQANAVLEGALKRLSSGQRTSLVKNLFGSGKSLGWLTDVLRHEIFDHGLYGDRPKDSKEWLLTADEFKFALDAMISRFRSLTPETLRKTPDPIIVFYSWIQGKPGDMDAIRTKLTELLSDDDDFLEILDGMRSWRAINGEVSHPLRKSTIDRFLNFDEVENRLNQLRSNADPMFADRAETLLSVISRED